jgi:hypothetical protein
MVDLTCIIWGLRFKCSQSRNRGWLSSEVLEVKL